MKPAGTVVVVNRKGGVGKTTLAVGLAGVFAETVPVTLIDADPQGHAYGWLEGSNWLTVELATAPAELARALAIRREGVVVVDAPAHDARVAREAVEHATAVVVPLGPSPLDVLSARPLLEALAEGARPGLAVLCRVDWRAGSRTRVRELVEAIGAPIARAELVQRVAHVEAAVVHAPVTRYEPNGKAAAEVRAVAHEVAAVLRKGAR